MSQPTIHLATQSAHQSSASVRGLSHDLRAAEFPIMIKSSIKFRAALVGRARQS
jgi:hypothetical protein